MKHIVDSVILEQHKNCDLISFLDISDYIKGIEPKNPMLQITLPNWETYHSITYNLNAITLIKPEHVNHKTFPSGVYHFIQSICPNDKLKNEFCYLHTCPEIKRINELACFYMNQDCGEYEEDLEKLFNLKFQLEMSSNLITEGEIKKGTELFNIATKEITSLENKKDCDVC